MALTLVEAAKLHSGEVKRAAIIELFAQGSDLLRVLPFDTIAGNALQYNREETLPGIGFRGVNEAYTESTGIINPLTEPLVIAGGDLDVDIFILETMGQDQRAVQEAMKTKALALRWSQAIIKGDSSVDPRVFDGLQLRLTGTQKVQAGTTANGTALSLAVLDQAIDACDNPTHLIMNKTMRRRLSAAARTTTIGGFITYGKDEFGRQITMYNDLPILVIEQDNAGNEILPFTEAATSGTATATSIYVASLGEGRLQGIQSGVMSVRDLGEIQTQPVKRTRVEWYAGIALFHPRAAVRLWSIADAAVVA